MPAAPEILSVWMLRDRVAAATNRARWLAHAKWPESCDVMVHIAEDSVIQKSHATECNSDRIFYLHQADERGVERCLKDIGRKMRQSTQQTVIQPHFRHFRRHGIADDLCKRQASKPSFKRAGSNHRPLEL